MTDTNKKEEKKVKWTSTSEGVFETYSNQGHLNWSLDDVSLHFGQIGSTEIGPGVNSSPINVHKATVTIPWRNAKILRNQLEKIIGNYEAANGEINIYVKLASNEGT